MRIVPLALLLIAGVAHAAPTPQCEPRILWPLDGETNVAPDAQLRVHLPPCAPQTISLLDASGAPIAFDTSPLAECFRDGCLTITPRAPMAAGADFTLLIVGNTIEDECRSRPNRVRFHTAARPTFLEIVTLEDRSEPEVFALNLRFSEQIDGRALEREPSLIGVTREDGLALLASIDPTGDVSTVPVTLKLNSPIPPAGTRFRVRIAKELKFRSGASLPAAIDVTTAHGIREGVELEPCPGVATDLGFGCATGGAGAAALLAFGLRRWRRDRRVRPLR